MIEMNPRVSRSSALASKATGYPIAKVAAKLAVGYTLDEIPNDLTGTTPASFEPTLDYVVVKCPRFAFEKFPGADRTLGTQMKSVGESMGIGRTFAEAFAKARRGLEIDQPTGGPRTCTRGSRRELEPCQPPDGGRRLSTAASTPAPARSRRASNYFYSTRGEVDEAPPEPGRSVVILGSGPNRIGQGIEFDYCCVHAAQSFRAQGYEAVMVNCNPETVSTDYDTLRPALLRAARRGGRARGARARAAGRRLHPVRRPDAAQARARDRARRLPHPRHAVRRDRPRRGPRAVRRGSRAEVGVRCPEWGIARAADEAAAIAERIGYPVLVRPSYVLGGRAMRVCYDARRRRARRWPAVDGAVLVDRFLENAIELDVDALCDGSDDVRRRGDGARRGGRHPLRRLVVRAARAVRLRRASATLVRRLGPALGVVGLLNVQLAIARRRGLRARGQPARVADGAVRVEGDRRQPRRRRLPARRGRAARRARPAARGARRAGYHVKAAVLPFARFPGADPVLGPEMRSTGEVMASARRLRDRVREGRARRRAARCRPAAARSSPSATRDKVAVAAGRARARSSSASSWSRPPARRRRSSRRGDRRSTRVEKGDAGRRPRPRAAASTSSSTRRRAATPARDGYAIREAAVVARVPCITTLAVARAAVEAIAKARAEPARLAPGAACRERGGEPRRERSSRRRGDRPVRAPARRRAAALDPGVPGPVLHARGARPRAAAADVALPRAARRARVPDRPDRARARARSRRSSRATRSPCSARSGTASGSTCRGRCSSAAGSASRRCRTSPRRSSARRPCSASAASTTPRRPCSSRTPRS